MIYLFSWWCGYLDLRLPATLRQQPRSHFGVARAVRGDWTSFLFRCESLHPGLSPSLARVGMSVVVSLPLPHPAPPLPGSPCVCHAPFGTSLAARVFYLTLVVQRAALGLVEVEEWEPEAANPESRPVLAPASQNNSKVLLSRVTAQQQLYIL